VRTAFWLWRNRQGRWGRAEGAVSRGAAQGYLTRAFHAILHPESAGVVWVVAGLSLRRVRWFRGGASNSLQKEKKKEGEKRPEEEDLSGRGEVWSREEEEVGRACADALVPHQGWSSLDKVAAILPLVEEVCYLG